jgi:hypothetical protein
VAGVLADEREGARPLCVPEIGVHNHDPLQ